MVNRRTLTAILGAVLGMLVFILIYGIRVIDPTYDDWLMTGYQDLVQHYLGWVSYRVSSWHFPIGLIDGIVYPDMISVVYTDSVPLFAIVFKLLSPVLPETFQYFGLFGLSCFALMGYFSTLLLYHFTDRRAFSLAGSLFFTLSYIMLDRMFFHTALAAHFIILAALAWWYIYMPDAGTVKNTLAFVTLGAIALLTEAYFIPMVWGIMLCALLSELMKHHDIVKVIIPILFAAVITLVLGYVIGVFYGDVSATTSGLGVFSFNLNGLYNSQGRSALIGQRPFNLGQNEGFAYLGCGMLLLAAVSVLIAVISAIVNLVTEKGEKNVDISLVVPHALYITCFTVFAISPVITFGERTFSLDIPEPLFDIWSVFRSSGRMIWPVYYLIMLWVLVVIGRKCRPSVALVLLMAGLLIQVYDERGFITEKQERYLTEAVYTSSLTSAAWDELADRYSHIMVYPKTFTMYSNYKGEELWAYALEHDMTMNIVYLARDLSLAADEAAYSRFNELASGESYPDTMYVFIDEMPTEEVHLYYYDIDGLTVGVPDDLSTGN